MSHSVQIPAWSDVPRGARTLASSTALCSAPRAMIHSTDECRLVWTWYAPPSVSSRSMHDRTGWTDSAKVCQHPIKLANSAPCTMIPSLPLSVSWHAPRKIRQLHAYQVHRGATRHSRSKRCVVTRLAAVLVGVPNSGRHILQCDW